MMNDKVLHEDLLSVAALSDASDPITAQRWTLLGRVQGLGVRPALARLAMQHGLAGSAANTGAGVELEIEGSPTALAAFRQGIKSELPAGTRLEQITSVPITLANRKGFEITVSSRTGALAAQVPGDRAVCHECLNDVARLDDSRHDYPFTCCANCGPRYSLIDAMPYDRQQTGMAGFSLCRDCRREYKSLGDRRFHAETICCPRCGPHVWATNGDGVVLGERALAISVVIDALLQGRIVAVRGLGGYQLLADATNEDAVKRLRSCKGRPAKPFALLVASIAAAAKIAHLSEVERRALADAANPIVIPRRRADSPVAPEVYGMLDTIGLMLPTTPLHWQLVTRCNRPLVATSGNFDGAPLAYEVASAQAELSGVADCWLHHNRPIVRPIDDSVVRVIADREVSLRLARGLAPLPLDLGPTPPMLAVGGHQKCAIALSNGSQAVLGPHIGDLDELTTRQRWLDHVAAFVKLYGAVPTLIVHDLHPDYFTTRWARADGWPTLAVQHHHAHAAAAMIEHDWLDREVLALTWDGTGYGPDGSIWGGECLLATASTYHRVAHCRSFALPGGDAAIREPWRTAVSLVTQAAGDEATRRLKFEDITPTAIDQVARLAAHPYLSPRTSSIGRLFDGAACLALGIPHAAYEGEPASLLEAACDPAAPGCYTLPLTDGSPVELDWRSLIVELLADRAAGASPGAMAIRFHRALAKAAIGIARRYPNHPMVLSGGVFQNRVLVELIADWWPRRADQLGLPGLIPPGDGGLAAGQLAVAAARIRQGGIA
jgi:hydrogenase maturation protein HypF